MPASMEYGFKHAQLYNGNTMIADYGNITEEMLRKNAGHRIQIHPDAIYGERENLNNVPVYVKVKERDDIYEILYVVYFTYSGPFSMLGLKYGHHDSDLEHVSVRICKKTGKLIGVYYSYHSEGLWKSADEVEMENGHPVVYVAKSSHGFYPHRGTHFRIFGFANDKMNNGRHWMPERVIRVDGGNGTEIPYWMSYRGQLSMAGIDSLPLKGWFRDFEPDESSTEFRDCFLPCWYPKCILCSVPFVPSSSSLSKKEEL